MFEKKIDIYKKKDKATWIQIKTALKEGGLTGFKAGHYLQESVMAGGCGAKLEKANEILLRNGLVAEIDETLMTDAALKTKRSYI